MFALQVKMSIFTEVTGKTSEIFLLHQMQKELKYQAKVPPTQRNEKHLELPPNALASKKANFQHNAAL